MSLRRGFDHISLRLCKRKAVQLSMNLLLFNLAVLSSCFSGVVLLIIESSLFSFQAIQLKPFITVLHCVFSNEKIRLELGYTVTDYLNQI